MLSLIGPAPYGTNITEDELKAYTDISYANGSVALEELNKSKTFNQNGGIGIAVSSSNSQVNEGFDHILEKEVPSVSDYFSFKMLS